MKTFKAGIIGCGRIGSLLEDDPLRGKPCTHVGGFNALPSVKITAGCDIDAVRLEQFGKRWGVTRLYEDYRKMFREEKLDIVCVAAWTQLHAEMTMAAARAGVRGIYCEKPIALDLKQASDMVRLCERKKIALVVNHERRWDYYYRVARKTILAGKIGEVRTIVGNALSWQPPTLPAKIHGGGGMFHDGTHLTDLLLYFGGPIRWVSAHENRPNGKEFIEETSWAMMEFKSGAVGFIEGGGNRKYFNFELDIQGSEGRILIGNNGREMFLTRQSRRFTGFRELERVPFPEPKCYETPFVGGARDMIRCIKNGTESISSGRDGLRALEVILAIYRSAAEQGKRIKLQF